MYNINTSPWQDMWSDFVDFLPQLLGALVVIIIGYVVAKILQWVVKNILSVVRFDQVLLKSPAGNFLKNAFDSPTRFVAKVVFWLVLLGAIAQAIATLNVDALNGLVAAIYAYLPHVIAAVIIFLVASTVSAAAVNMINRTLGNSPLARTASAVAPALIMSIAIFMILNELMIAPEIVMITYTAIIGAVALGLALAFGLGGRDVAARLLEQAYTAGKKTASQAKQDASRNRKK